MRKQRILAILLAGLLAFSSCEELPLPAEEIETGAVGIRNTTSKAEPASEEEPQREFCLPEVIELGPGESLALDLPSDAAIESGDETVVSAASAVLTAGEKGETTLSVTLDGTTKEAAVRVVAFEDPEETIPEELPKGKYLLVVNKKRNYVVVYDLKDEAREHPLKAMICSTGEATPDKTYKIGYHKVWNRLYGNVWGNTRRSSAEISFSIRCPLPKRTAAPLSGNAIMSSAWRNPWAVSGCASAIPSGSMTAVKAGRR